MRKPDTRTSLDREADDALEALLAEYEALRAESDRIAQLLSNAVWVGVTGFGLTIVAAGSFVAAGFDFSHIVPAVALILVAQAMAISIMYVSEVWKYSRVGAYIRVKCEGYYVACAGGDPPEDTRFPDGPPAMYWEHWIRGHRAKALHYASIVFLQSPVVCVLVGLIGGEVVRVMHWNLEQFMLGRWAMHLTSDPSLSILLAVLLITDLVIMWGQRSRVKKAEKGDFGDGNSLGRLATPVSESSDAQ